MCGLPEGSLLGKYKEGSNIISTNIGRPKLHPRALSGDEKKALMAKMDRVAAVRVTEREVHIQQRDQALKRIAELEKEVDTWKAKANALEVKPIRRIIRERIAKWLLDRG